MDELKNGMHQIIHGIGMPFTSALNGHPPNHENQAANMTLTVC